MVYDLSREEHPLQALVVSTLVRTCVFDAFHILPVVSLDPMKEPSSIFLHSLSSHLQLMSLDSVPYIFSAVSSRVASSRYAQSSHT